MNDTKLSQSSEDVLLNIDINKRIYSLNLRRIILICLLVLGIELLRLMINIELNEALFRIGLLLHIILSVFYLVITGLYIKSEKENPSTSKFLIISFWTLFSISSIPLFLFDMKNSILQLHFIIIGTILILAPVLSLWEDAIVFSVNTIVTLSTISFTNYNKTLFYFSIFANLLAFFVARLLHSDIVKLLKKLQEEINTDYLTKLPNRRAGFESMKQLWQTCQRLHVPCYIAAIDIDFFKQYNDTYGHFKGDMALTSVARCLEKCFSRASDIVCRTGGEEFMVAFSAPDDKAALIDLNNLQERIANQRILSANTQVSEYLTISIGVASVTPKPDENETSLFMEADQNLYIAKEAGRNVIVLNGKVYES